jgi:imidazolonepropionase
VVASRPRSFAIHNATLVTLAPLALAAGAQATIEADDLGLVERGTLLVENGVITAVGKQRECAPAVEHARSRYAAFEERDALGNVVMPGFVDAHTHAIFAGNRIADFEDLAAGRKPGLGMPYTIEQTRGASEEALAAVLERHLSLMRSHGTTTAEVKSGYHLDARGELRLLSIIARLGARPDLPRVVPTFCGAHALAPEFDDYDAFVDELCLRILPQVAEQGIAWFADAFCETGFFSPAQSERFLRACAAKGLRLRIHADEMGPSGGSAVAARLRTASADHLNFIDNQEIEALAAAGCIAVLCPGTVDYLHLPRYAPARPLMEMGVPVALATDFNPGTCPCFSLQAVVSLARRHMGMSVAEAIAAITLNAAYSLGLGGEIGSLTAGKRADIVQLVTDDYRELGYFFGTNMVAHAWIGAKTA